MEIQISDTRMNQILKYGWVDFVNDSGFMLHIEIDKDGNFESGKARGIGTDITVTLIAKEYQE